MMMILTHVGCVGLGVFIELKEEKKRDIQQELVDWINKHRPINTLRSYSSQQRQYDAWCLKNNITTDTPNSNAFALYITHLADMGRAYGTLVNARAAYGDRFRYHPDITTSLSNPYLAMVMRASKTVAPPPTHKTPILPHMIHQMCTIGLLTSPPLPKSSRDLLIIILMFTAMLRRSEVVALKSEDVWYDKLTLRDGVEEPVLFVFVEKAKNDQERRGHTRVVACNDAVGSWMKTVSPIYWFEQWSSIRNSKASTFFHHLHSADPLAPETINNTIKRWIQAIGEDPSQYSSHSARAGGCTAAAREKVEKRLLSRHGNWRSDAIDVYIHDSMEDRISVTKSMFTTSSLRVPHQH